MDKQITKHICFDEMIQLEKGLSESPEILVVGTFNPEGENNEAKWYYGREINEFWFLFPRMLGHKSVHPADIDDIREHPVVCKEFCSKNNIVIIDILKQIEGSLEGFTDKEINENAKTFVSFDYEAAFKNNKPKKVVFTWKGCDGKVIGKVKKSFINYLNENNIKYCEVPSASPIYRKGRKAKLEEWTKAFNEIK